MARHNEVTMVGYVKDPPHIEYLKETETKIATFSIYTVPQGTDGVQTVPISYSAGVGEKRLMEIIQRLQPYDLIELKGVVNIRPERKIFCCPECGERETKEHGTVTSVYPIWLKKLNNPFCDQNDNEQLNEMLRQQYAPVSNCVILLGTVCSVPRWCDSDCCRYRIGLNRTYYIQTQPKVHADYPWIYSYGDQAERDMETLRLRDQVFVEGWFRSRNIQMWKECKNCGHIYSVPETVCEVVPYSTLHISHMAEETEKWTEDERQLFTLTKGDIAQAFPVICGSAIRARN